MESPRRAYFGFAGVCALSSAAGALAWSATGRLFPALSQAALTAVTAAAVAAVWLRRLQRLKIESARRVTDHRQLLEESHARAADLERDLAARVMTQEALRQSEQRFRQLVEKAPFAIVVEGGLRFRYLNPAALEMLGAVSPEELIGTPLADRVHVEKGAVVRLDGESFPADVFPAAIVYDGEPASLLLLRDRSLETRLEQERLGMEQRLQRARKMESIGRLAAGVAHDFSNHLTVINGYCDMLLEELASDDPLREELGEIRAAGSRAAGLTDQLLAFGRRQPAELRPVDLNAAVREHCRAIGEWFGHGVEVIADLSPDLDPVAADPVQLRQALMNLSLNAREAMPRGGKLLFGTSPAEIPQAAGDAEPGHYAVLSVSDTGIGMSAETLSHLFEPFFTTKPAGSGAGLGLSTVFGIAERCGGFVRAASEPGAGATIRVYLRRAAEDVREAEVLGEPRPASEPR
jgi:signal transduction histidine kinase